MSDVPQGPGWWYASDGRWYPPESAPDWKGVADGARPADAPLDVLDEENLDADEVTGQRERLVRRALEYWVRSLVDLTGRNRLLYFRHTRRGTIDLTAGTALDPDEAAVDSLLAGNRVTFSVLFRDRDHRTEAAAKARAINAKAKELLEERGLAALHVAYGMASWDEQKSAATPAAPVVLLPLELKPQGVAGEDWALKVAGDPEEP